MKDWRLETVLYVPRALDVSSCLHVTLMVFLRFFSISKPMKYEAIHIQLRHKSIVIIWIVSFLAELPVALFQFYSKEDLYLYSINIHLWVFLGLPLLSLLCMKIAMLWILKGKTKKRTKACLADDPKKKFNTLLSTTDGSDYVDTMSRKMILLVQRLVLFHLVCYVPYLAWWQYYNVMIDLNRPWRMHQLEVIIT